MKRISGPALAALLAGVGAGLFLAACAGLPAPRSESDALVVGYLSLEFPEGFLGQPPRTLRSGILLHFANVTLGTRFSRFTRGGYFAFRADGGQQLLLEGYEYSADDPDYQSYLNDEIGVRFSTEAGKVLDLGRITIRYTAPARSGRVTFAQSTHVEDVDVDGKTAPLILSLRHDYWAYLKAFVRLWDPAALSEYLRRADPAGRWQLREVLR